MFDKNSKILAVSPWPSTIHDSGKSWFFNNMMGRLLKEGKSPDTVMITDSRGEALRAFRSKNIPVYHLVQSMDQIAAGYASNNWRKMHGYPLRRKMHNKVNRTTRKWNRIRAKQSRPCCVRLAMDETYTAYQVGYESD